MPPDRGRASRACTACRKIKTRCYESDLGGRPCLRCDRLGQPCSLATRPVEGDDGRQAVNLSIHGGSSLSDDRYGFGLLFGESVTLTQRRLTRLEQTVSALVKRLSDGSPYARPAVVPSPAPVPPHANDAASGAHSSAPVLLIRDVAYEVGVRQQPAPGALSRTENLSLDIIDQGVISAQEAYTMIELFVSLPLRLRVG
jgi:hypothetical protein